jgi:hypothetical protein
MLQIRRLLLAPRRDVNLSYYNAKIKIYLIYEYFKFIIFGGGLIHNLVPNR